MLYTFIGIIAGFGISFFFYRRSLRDPEIRFACWNSVILDVSDHLQSEVAIRVTGIEKNVSTVSLSHIIIWNSGLGALRPQDKVKDRGITITPPAGERILSARTVGRSRDASQFVAAHSPDGARVAVGFDHMNAGDWISVRLLHTGRHAPDVTGEFVGTTLRPYKPPSHASTALLWGAGFVCVTMTAYRSAAAIALAEAGVNPPVMSLAAPITNAVISAIGFISFIIWLAACAQRLLFRRTLPISMQVIFTDDYKPFSDFLPKLPMQADRPLVGQSVDAHEKTTGNTHDKAHGS